MVVEELQLPEQDSVVSRRNFSLSRQPAENVVVANLEQVLELGKFGLSHSGDFGVGETADENIRLTHATMPGAEQNFPPAGIEIGARNLRAGHGNSDF